MHGRTNSSKPSQYSVSYVIHLWGLRSSLGLDYHETARIMGYQMSIVYICLLLQNKCSLSSCFAHGLLIG